MLHYVLRVFFSRNQSLLVLLPFGTLTRRNAVAVQFACSLGYLTWASFELDIVLDIDSARRPCDMASVRFGQKGCDS